MSALTKIFVVLLVVMSLMLASGLVVFVNRMEPYKADLEKERQEKVVAEAKTAAIQAEVKLTTAEKETAIAELQTKVHDRVQEIDGLNKTIAQKTTDAADKDNQIAQLVAAQKSLTDANKVQSADIQARQVAFNTLHDDNDKLQRRVVDSDVSITELTNANDILKRQARYMQEQIAQLQQQNTQLTEILRKYNISPTGQTLPAGGAINNQPSVNLSGIVRDTTNIHGVPWATISLGSADAVTKGMKFSVVDPTAKRFLGYFTVDAVGVHEATGRLELRDGVDSVRPNVSEVRTQL